MHTNRKMIYPIILLSWLCVEGWFDHPTWQWWERVPPMVQADIVLKWRLSGETVDDPQALWEGKLGEAWHKLPDIVRDTVLRLREICQCCE